MEKHMKKKEKYIHVKKSNSAGTTDSSVRSIHIINQSETSRMYGRVNRN